ncbi:MAG: hypothetical protein AAF999_04170 [Pseudomonadota bacterium]
MPLQNRVQPDGSIIAHPARGRFMGNRGILHDDAQRLGRVRWRHKAWVTCLLAFKGRHRQIMRPNNYTELFFWDEAVAFAAGHRPCGECRRADYNRFREAAGITTPIKLFDAALHADRAEPKTYRQRRHEACIGDLPNGTFILNDRGQPALVLHDALLPYAPLGYSAPAPRPKTGTVTVLTPRLLIATLRDGYDLKIAVQD